MTPNGSKSKHQSPPPDRQLGLNPRQHKSKHGDATKSCRRAKALAELWPTTSRIAVQPSMSHSRHVALPRRPERKEAMRICADRRCSRRPPHGRSCVWQRSSERDKPQRCRAAHSTRLYLQLPVESASPGALTSFVVPGGSCVIKATCRRTSKQTAHGRRPC